MRGQTEMMHLLVRKGANIDAIGVFFSCLEPQLLTAYALQTMVGRLPFILLLKMGRQKLPVPSSRMVQISMLLVYLLVIFRIPVSDC
jgi:hypothetical protein